MRGGVRMSVGRRDPTEEELIQLIVENDSRVAANGSSDPLAVISRWKDETGNEKDLPHPLMKIGDAYYLLGKWLGDGSSGTQIFELGDCYKKNSESQYQLESQPECIVKKIPYNLDRRKYYQQIYSTFIENKKATSEELGSIFSKSINHELEMLVQVGDVNATKELDRKNGVIFLKMSKVDGIALDKYLIENPQLTFAERSQLADLVANAVEDLHNKGVCHLDLKPENILYDPENQKINFIDFGSAQKINADLSDSEKNPAYLHLTTPMFDPPDHNLNKPAQIDHYGLAGVIGEVFGLVYEKKDYQFERLKKIPYYDSLNENEKFEMEMIIETLKILGHKNREQRGEKPYQEIKQETIEQKTQIDLFEASGKLSNSEKSLEQYIIDLALKLPKNNRDKIENFIKLESAAKHLEEITNDQDGLVVYSAYYKDISNAILNKDLSILLAYSAEDLDQVASYLIESIKFYQSEYKTLYSAYNASNVRIGLLNKQEEYKENREELLKLNFTGEELERLNRGEAEGKVLLQEEQIRNKDLSTRAEESKANSGFANEAAKMLEDVLSVARVAKEMDYQPQYQEEQQYQEGELAQQYQAEEELQQGDIPSPEKPSRNSTQQILAGFVKDQKENPSLLENPSFRKVEQASHNLEEFNDFIAKLKNCFPKNLQIYFDQHYEVEPAGRKKINNIILLTQKIEDFRGAVENYGEHVRLNDYMKASLKESIEAIIAAADQEKSTPRRMLKDVFGINRGDRTESGLTEFLKKNYVDKIEDQWVMVGDPRNWQSVMVSSQNQQQGQKEEGKESQAPNPEDQERSSFRR